MSRGGHYVHRTSSNVLLLHCIVGPYVFILYMIIIIITRKRAIAKALQPEGHFYFAPVDLPYYQHFLFFCSKILRFGKLRVETTNAGHVTPRPLSTIN